jgi:hypothetical protein
VVKLSAENTKIAPKKRVPANMYLLILVIT